MARIAIDAATAERAFKAGLTFPPGTQVYNEAESRAISESQSSKQDVSAALPRDGWGFGPWPFGPGVPIIPAPISPRRKDGQPYPRRTEYPVSWNLPGVGTPLVPWRVLRQAAETDVIRRCIELRKSELAYTDWDITPTEGAIEALAVATGNSSKASVKRELIRDTKDEIDRVKRFFARPDRLNDLTFGDWMAGLLEEHFVLDATTIYPWRDERGSLHSFVGLDGSTIKPLLDVNGNRPQPPNPAYQQFIAGFPRGEFTDMGAGDNEFATTDLVYLPRLRRAHTPYGFSNVEQALVVLDLWLKRQAWIRAEYTDGVKPDSWMRTNVEMTPERLVQWETIINEHLSGQTQERARLKVLPMGFEPQETVQFSDKYHPTYDEFLIRLLCMTFDIQPVELGFMPSGGGLGGKGFFEQNENITYRRALRPMFMWMSAFLNDLAIRYLGMPSILTFAFLGFEDENEQIIAQTRSAEQRDGALTINERRAERGLSLFDIPEADEPMVYAGSTIIPLKGLLETQQAQREAQVAGAQAATSALGTDGAQGTEGEQGAEGSDGAKPADGAGAAASPSAQSPPSAATSADAEAKKFLAFARARVRDGRWRPFEFASGLSIVAADLNRAGETLDLDAVKLAAGVAVKAVGGGADPKADRRRKAAKLEATRRTAAKRYVPLVRSAFGGLLSADALTAAVEAYSVQMQKVKAAGDGPDPSEVQAAHGALSGAFDADALAEAASMLSDLWSEGYVTGAVEADELLGLEPAWQLDNWRAVAELLGQDGARGLAGMLDDAEVTIRSISESRLDVLAQTLAEGIHNGDPVKVVGKALEGVLDDPQWAEMVANTEMNRAMSTGSLDQYRTAGVEFKSWLTADRPCPICESNEADEAISLESVFTSGDDAPPAHPNCMCALIPVTPGDPGYPTGEADQ
jgi:hypothetical protein